MAKETYKDKLGTAAWQRRKTEILVRDNLKCQAYNCKTPDALLHVHHKDYLGGLRPENYPDDMLITLCENCHKKENLRFNYEQQFYDALKLQGFLLPDIIAFTTLLHHDKNFTTNLLNNLRKIQNG